MTDYHDDITKLNFSRVTDLQVRKKEFNEILGIMTSMAHDPPASTSRPSPIVMIHGHSGTGKTTLVHKLQQSTASKEGFFFIQGKYDQRKSEVPFYAILHALTELCAHIQNEQGIQEELQREMDQSDIHVLAHVLPEAVPLCCANDKHNVLMEGEMIHCTLCNWHANSSSSSSLENTRVGPLPLCDEEFTLPSTNTVNLTLKNIQLHVVLRKFLDTICASSTSRRILFFQDDLQWADAASLDLLQALVLENQLTNNGLLFIGAYRDNDLVGGDRGAPFAFLQKCQSNDNFSVTNISLKNFDIEMVSKYLSVLLRLEQAETNSLAMVILDKTDGNAFFMVQFLQFLQSTTHLYFCSLGMRWKWDADKIRRQTNISDNVVNMVLDKIRVLPKHVQSALQIASCIGSRFSISTLSVCMAAVNESETPRIMIHEQVDPVAPVQEGHYILSLIEQANVLGLVEASSTKGTGKYKFTHDRVQQAAYSLLPEGHDKKMLHLSIGCSILRMKVPRKEYFRFVLLAVNQLNLAKDLIVDKNEKVRLAELNFEAVNVVISKSAFFPALEFLVTGRSLIEDMDKWGIEHYDFSLKLCNLLATIAYVTGDFERCKKVVDEVNLKAKTPAERGHVNTTWVEVLVSTGQVDEAFKYGIHSVGQLGVYFPKRPNMIHAISSLFRTKLMLRGKPDDALGPTQRNTDRSKIEALCIIDNLIEASFLASRSEYFILMSIRSILLTLEHGGTIRSVAGYGCAGIIFASMGDFKVALRMGEISLKLAEAYHPSGHDARACFLVYFLLFHWRHPLHEGLNPVLRAYEAAMDVGDIKNAAWCATAYLSIYFCCGLPLGPWLNDVSKYRKQMLAYNQMVTYMILAPYHQAVINLMGMSSGDPSCLDGEHIQVDTFMKDMKDTNNAVALNAVYKNRLFLGYHFDDLNVAYEMSKTLRGKVLEAEGTSAFLPQLVFYQGLTSVELARTTPTTRRMRHRREGHRALKKLESWTKSGAVNCHHLLLILTAETLAMKRGSKPDDVRSAFDRAIGVCGRSGFVPDKALANERAGAYHANRKDSYHANFYFEQAKELYTEWGAIAKADHLDSKYASYLPHGSSGMNLSFRSTNIKGRSRYSNESSEKHRIDLFDAPSEFLERET